MTIEDVIQIVESETGQKVSPDTELSTLGLDSLEFLDLLIRVGNIEDEKVPDINTVRDLWAAQYEHERCQ